MSHRQQPLALTAFWSITGPEPAPVYGGGEDPSPFLMHAPDPLGVGLEFGLGDHGGDGWGGEEFFVGRRQHVVTGSGSESESSGSEFSRARPVDGDGSRILRYEPDSDSDEQIVAVGDDSASILDDEDQIQSNPSLNLNIPLCWDCLRIEEDRRDPSAEEFEWEEIDGRAEERDRNLEEEPQQQEEDYMGPAEWEFLWMNHHFGGNTDDAAELESYYDEGFVYATTEYDDVMFAQFQDQPQNGRLGLGKGCPPAAKSVVESLPSFVVKHEDLQRNQGGITCAVCKDEIVVEESVKKLPCSHCYHEDCILPWLGMRNTCPLCRYELPTDDPEYERWKARRGPGIVGGGGMEVVEVDEGVRYDFEILPAA